MRKALALCQCQTAGTVFGELAVFGEPAKRVATLFAVLLVACVTISCVLPAPAGESAAISVIDVQQGTIEKGQPVRWGGTIAKVHNKADTTVLEIVSRPLLRSGRPKHNDVTDGRFMAEITGFLDPEIVRPGRDISVIGSIVRLDKGLVGEAEYSYPVMSVFDYQFWKEQSEVDPAAVHPYYLFSDRYWQTWPHRRRSGVHGQLIF